MKIFIISILLFINLGNIIGQSLLKQYTYFTPERKNLITKMGDFYDQTIRENFPSDTDTSSYKLFFECLLRNAEQQRAIFILQVDRDQLKEINQSLFKDQNYYFVYVRSIHCPEKDKPLCVKQQDSVPTRRYTSPYLANDDYPVSAIPTWLLNRDGYINAIISNNPVVQEMQFSMKIAGDLGIVMFIQYVRHIKLQEVSTSDVKELGAVLFWRYLCFCGGVDMIERKGYDDL